MQIRLEIDGRDVAGGPAQLDSVRLLGRLAPPWATKVRAKARSTAVWDAAESGVAAHADRTAGEAGSTRGGESTVELRAELSVIHQRMQEMYAAFEDRDAQVHRATASHACAAWPCAPPREPCFLVFLKMVVWFGYSIFRLTRS